MREIITKVMEAETEGRKIVEAAKNDAARILLASREKAREFTNRIRRDTQIEIDQMTEASVGIVQQEKQACLARATENINARIPLDQPARQQAVIAAIRCICGLAAFPEEAAPARV